MTGWKKVGGLTIAGCSVIIAAGMIVFFISIWVNKWASPTENAVTLQPATAASVIPRATSFISDSEREAIGTADVDMMDLHALAQQVTALSNQISIVSERLSVIEQDLRASALAPHDTSSSLVSGDPSPPDLTPPSQEDWRAHLQDRDRILSEVFANERYDATASTLLANSLERVELQRQLPDSEIESMECRETLCEIIAHHDSLEAAQNFTASFPALIPWNTSVELTREEQNGASVSMKLYATANGQELPASPH